ncbi:MAG: zinc metallopeptidase [Bacteroidales bacterium]|nr:zinc metallopeptidase [Bacteroidales bacterium]
MIGSGYIIIFLIFVIVSWIIGEQLKSRFKKYSKIAVNNQMSGKEVAEKMLHENGIYDVKVVSVEGQLSDHYNPATKTVNLSRDVYYGRSIASAAIASHECGHAVQHAKAYSMLQFRTALVPLQNISAKIMNVIFIMMFFGVFMFNNFISIDLALYVIVGCYAIFTLFAFVTLPVEIDASKRALMWLNSSGITGYGTHEKAEDALKWAAYTYVVAALSSLAMLLYFLFMLAGRRN